MIIPSASTFARQERQRHRRRHGRKTTATILRVIERAPLWLRYDLEAKHIAVRRRAEETLAAIIADGLANEAGARTDE